MLSPAVLLQDLLYQKSSSHKDMRTQTISVALNGAGCISAAGWLLLELRWAAFKSKEVISDLSP